MGRKVKSKVKNKANRSRSWYRRPRARAKVRHRRRLRRPRRVRPAGTFKRAPKAGKTARGRPLAWRHSYHTMGGGRCVCRPPQRSWSLAFLRCGRPRRAPREFAEGDRRENSPREFAGGDPSTRLSRACLAIILRVSRRHLAIISRVSRDDLAIIYDNRDNLARLRGGHRGAPERVLHLRLRRAAPKVRGGPGRLAGLWVGAHAVLRGRGHRQPARGRPGHPGHGDGPRRCGIFFDSDSSG